LSQRDAKRYGGGRRSINRVSHACVLTSSAGKHMREREAPTYMKKDVIYDESAQVRLVLGGAAVREAAKVINGNSATARYSRRIDVTASRQEFSKMRIRNIVA